MTLVHDQNTYNLHYSVEPLLYNNLESLILFDHINLAHTIDSIILDYNISLVIFG